MPHPAPVPHTRILLGLFLGAAAGSLVNVLFVPDPKAPPEWLAWLLRNVTEPGGKVFLNLLMMTVVPLVFCSLAVGVAQLGGLGSLGRVGAKTFAYFLATTAFAAVIGLGLVNAVQPGKGLPEETVAQMKASFAGQAAEKAKPAAFGVETFVAVVPRNPIDAAARMDMLAVIFFALLVGVGIGTLEPDKAELSIRGLEAVADVMVFIIGVAMRVAPVGVFCLIFTTTSKFGFGLLVQLGYYVAVVVVGLCIQMFVVFPVLVRALGGMRPLAFFRGVRAPLVTAFSTSSSNATLPTSIRAAEEELGVPPRVASFVLPLGATMNMNGTALFEGVTVLFLAQVIGVDLTLGQQAVVVALSVTTAVGAAGVPGGSIPLLAMVLAAVGVPPEMLALVLGVDRILDMCRTAVNVIGDLTAAVFVARSEAQPAHSASLPARSASEGRR